MVRPGRVHDRADGQQHARHERGPVQLVVPDRQRLARAYRTAPPGGRPAPPPAPSAPARRRRPRRARRPARPWSRPASGRAGLGPRRGDQLAPCAWPCRSGRPACAGGACSMISTDSKYRAAFAANCIISTAPMPKFGAISTPTSGLCASQPRTRSSRCVGEAAGADDHVDALVDGPVQVVHDHVGRGEVDEHLGAGVRGVEQPVALVDHRHQLQVVGGVDRLAHLEAHAAPGAEHADADRFLRRSSRRQFTSPRSAERRPAFGPPPALGTDAGTPPPRTPSRPARRSRSARRCRPG